jgi:hypothetical protein
MLALRSPFYPRFFTFDRPSIAYAIGLRSTFYRFRSPCSRSPHTPRRIEAPLSALGGLAWQRPQGGGKGCSDLVGSPCGLASKPRRIARRRRNTRTDQQRESPSAYSCFAALRCHSTHRLTSGLPTASQRLARPIGSIVGSKTTVGIIQHQQKQAFTIATAPVCISAATLGRVLCGATEQAAAHTRAICLAKRLNGRHAWFAGPRRGAGCRVGQGTAARAKLDLIAHYTAAVSKLARLCLKKVRSTSKIPDGLVLEITGRSGALANAGKSRRIQNGKGNRDVV